MGIYVGKRRGEFMTVRMTRGHVGAGTEKEKNVSMHAVF